MKAHQRSQRSRLRSGRESTLVSEKKEKQRSEFIQLSERRDILNPHESMCKYQINLNKNEIELLNQRKPSHRIIHQDSHLGGRSFV